MVRFTKLTRMISFNSLNTSTKGVTIHILQTKQLKLREGNSRGMTQWAAVQRASGQCNPGTTPLLVSQHP